MRYEPFIQTGERQLVFAPSWDQIGVKCTAEDGSVSYVYLNPSTTDSESESDVFVYAGETGNPVEDEPQVFIVPPNTPEAA